MIDILAFGAHPDDIELSAAGTLMKEIDNGRNVAIVDLTKGELGTRGNDVLRLEEARAAADIMGVKERRNLGMKDGFLKDDEEHILQVVREIRRFQPEMVLCNALEDRHPDHGMAASLVKKACFHSGLIKLHTEDENGKQEAWRPKFLYNYIQFKYIRPDLLVDVSAFHERKMQAVRAYRSQFYDPNSKEAESLISSKEFLDFIEARSTEFGRIIGVSKAEGFNIQRIPELSSLFDIK